MRHVMIDALLVFHNMVLAAKTNVTLLHVNNNGADPHSLISAFVIRYMVSM